MNDDESDNYEQKDLVQLIKYDEKLQEQTIYYIHHCLYNLGYKETLHQFEDDFNIFSKDRFFQFITSGHFDEANKYFENFVEKEHEQGKEIKFMLCKLEYLHAIHFKCNDIYALTQKLGQFLNKTEEGRKMFEIFKDLQKLPSISYSAYFPEFDYTKYVETDIILLNTMLDKIKHIHIVKQVNLRSFAERILRKDYSSPNVSTSGIIFEDEDEPM